MFSSKIEYWVDGLVVSKKLSEQCTTNINCIKYTNSQ